MTTPPVLESHPTRQISVAPAAALSAPAVGARPRLRPRWLLGGVVLLVIAALLSWYIVDSLQAQNAVVVLRADVPRGTAVTAEALGSVTVGNVDGVSTVPASQIPDLVGKIAQIDLAKGALLPADAIADQQIPGAGNSLIGLVLAPGKVPGAAAIRPGDSIRMFEIPVDDTGKPGAVFPGEVSSIHVAADGVSIMMNVEVEASSATRIQLLAAVDRLAVVLDAI